VRVLTVQTQSYQRRPSAPVTTPTILSSRSRIGPLLDVRLEIRIERASPTGALPAYPMRPKRVAVGDSRRRRAGEQMLEQ
jgi:hypothetical protein